MRRYPEYKKSGVEWIEKMPHHWKLSRIDSLFFRRKEKNSNIISNNILSVLKDRGVIRYEDKGNIGNKVSENIENYQLVYVGDIVVNNMNVTIGSVGKSNQFGALSGIYIVLAPKKDNVNMEYYEYVFKVKSFQKSLIKISSGLMEIRESLNFIEFKTLKLPTPVISEQTQIANFLDRKTEQIDKLIRIKERRIELLQEQRTALINQVVTKGLDPNVEMKPSGVEWIGEIPSRWEVLKVKHVGLSNPSKNNPKTVCLKEEPVVFLPMERVHTDGSTDQELRLPYSQLKSGYTYFEEGDILIAKVTPCFENGKIVHIKNLATSVGFGSTEFIVIRPDLQKVFPPFLYYVLRNDTLRSIGKHFMTSAVGLKRVPTEFVEDFRIPIPIYQEQIQIANFLDHKTKQIDELIATEHKKIELLKEYRQSLISEVVTGKIDVRNEV